MSTETSTGCTRCGGSAIDPEDSFTGSYGGWIEEPPALEPCRDCVHPVTDHTTDPSPRPGRNARRRADTARPTPADAQAAMNALSLDTLESVVDPAVAYLQGRLVDLGEAPLWGRDTALVTAAVALAIQAYAQHENGPGLAAAREEGRRAGIAEIADHFAKTYPAEETRTDG